MWTSFTDSQWSELLVEMNKLFHQAVGQVQTGELSIHKWSIVCMFYGKLFFLLKSSNWPLFVHKVRVPSVLNFSTFICFFITLFLFCVCNMMWIKIYSYIMAMF